MSDSTKTQTQSEIGVLIVDDSPMTRHILEKGLSADKQIKIAGTAGNAFEAKDKVISLNPDVITLDLEMPKVNGMEFLRQLMAYKPFPVIVVSTLSEKWAKVSIEALRLGAVDVIAKPGNFKTTSTEDFFKELVTKVKTAAASKSKLNSQVLKKAERISDIGDNLRSMPVITKENRVKVIAMGASAGGTEAFRTLLESLTPTIPGIVLVQHMNAYFTKYYAQQLNLIGDIRIVEAQSGDRVENGKVLLAPGGFQMMLQKDSNGFYVVCKEDHGNTIHKPSVSVLFNSVAASAKDEAMGVILSGMGDDGADGLLNMRQQGALTFAQDKSTSMIFGMPSKAIEAGAVDNIVPIHQLGYALYLSLNKTQLS